MLRVLDKRVVADDVVAVTVGSPGRRLPDWTPGAHVDLVLPTGVTRQYSLCGDRWDTSRYRIGVLREAGGRGGSSYVHDGLAIGDEAAVGGPRNAFPMVPSRRYLFVAGGIGITPLLPMIVQANLLGADWRLLYTGRRRSSMAFLDELAVHRDRVHVHPRAEAGPADLPAFLGRARADTKVYCCGPERLLDEVSAACASWPPHTLRTERFVAGQLTTPARTAPFEVKLHRSDTTVIVPPGLSVLDAMARVGVEVLSSCRQGTCGTCETTVLGGVPDHRDSVLDENERAAGDCMFICVSRAATDRLVLDL